MSAEALIRPSSLEVKLKPQNLTIRKIKSQSLAAAHQIKRLDKDYVGEVPGCFVSLKFCADDASQGLLWVDTGRSHFARPFMLTL